MSAISSAARGTTDDASSAQDRSALNVSAAARFQFVAIVAAALQPLDGSNATVLGSRHKDEARGPTRFE
eukprot:CAMPEP_0183325460 /NCGR_PEP_ID=MMETSP0160_2-20130417/79608_1 /TAXON_ID=2839 ORGANISM="Odontella Sinensis, Strain Grunow 1884" /NCGR_SAMPLE_ID=MMETSP0160_2 /ASSEMBLY_ACC=CAM_ASM_000250 /LENGTH=68 /DNA_ID=CAMNT_0025493243 /DNA_START=505 /DNA_END=707 /DNA_ORIENTATION=-